MRGVCTASSDAGREAVAGRERWRCGAKFPFRRSKPHRPGAADRGTTGPAGGGQAQPERGLFAGGHSGGLGVGAEKAQRLKGTSTGGDAEQTRTPSRGTPGTWRTCGYFMLDKPRCREASRPVGPAGPLAFRAPSSFRGANSDDGGPGAGQEYGRRSVGFSEHIANPLETHWIARGNRPIVPRLPETRIDEPSH
jgi:hypothetical protein